MQKLQQFRCSAHLNAAVASGIIVVTVTLGPHAEVVQVPGVQANDARQELVVGDVLEHGAHHAPALMVQPLIAQVGVDLGHCKW